MEILPRSRPVHGMKSHRKDETVKSTGRDVSLTETGAGLIIFLSLMWIFPGWPLWKAPGECTRWIVSFQRPGLHFAGEPFVPRI